MDLGFKNSNCGTGRGLEAEKRRLLLAREVVLSPSEIAKTAREYGFVGAEPLPQTELATTARTATTEDPVRMQTAMQLNQPTSSTSAEKADARPRIANVPSSSNSKAAQDKDNKVKPTAATEPKAKRSGSKADSKPQSGAKKQGPEVADGRPRRVSNDKVRKDGGSRGLAGSR